MINPGDMMKAAGLFRKFQADHPKVVAFFQHYIGSGIPADSVIEITVTRPGEQPVTTNFRVLQDDIDMVEALKKLKK